MGTNKSIIQLIIEAVDKYTPKTTDLDKKIGAIGQKMQRTGMLMTVGLTAPVLAGFAKMVDSASDMAET